jgi:hypothetical protein
MKQKLAFLILLLGAMGPLLFGQAGPFSSNADVTLQFSASPTLGGTLTVDVYVNLSGITGSGSTAAALGGFAVPVAFDNTRLVLTAVNAPSGAFSPTDLVYTSLDRANARGFVTVINTQTGSGTPTGIIHAATLTFTATEAGKVLFDVNSARTVHEGSLSSTYTAAHGGPDEIPYDDALYPVQVASGGASYHLVYPILISTDADFQGVSVVNEGTSAADLQFRAYNQSGQLISQAGMTNPAEIQTPLPTLQQYVRMSQNLFGSSAPLGVTHGWIDVESPQPYVSGFFLLGHIEGSAINQMDGADVSHMSSAHLVFPVLGKDASRGTDLYVVNPSGSPATGTLTIMNSAGQIQQSIPLSLNSHGAYEASFDSTTISGDGYFDVNMTSGEVVGFEKFGNSQSLAAVNAQDVVTPSNMLFGAHFASGNYGIRYFTDLNVINPGGNAASVTFHLINDQGVEIVTPVVQTIQGHNQLRIMGHTLFGLPNPLTATSGVSGSVVVESDQGLVGSVTFGDAQNGQFLACLPFLSTSSAKRELFLDHVAIGTIGNTPYFTGIALVNPSKTRDASINVQLYNETGTLVAQTATPFVLAPGKRVSQMLGDFFPGFSGSQFGGFVKVTSDVEVFSFLLFGDTSLKFLSAVPVR